MLISFEGIDGSGKSTQIHLLSNYLIKSGFELVNVREPGGTGFSEAIREILLSGKYDINPIAELMLFDSARSQLINEVIKPALEQGIIVICDRFFDSTTAYQGYGRGLDLSSVETINNIAVNGLKPDITFFLDISIETSILRTKNKKYDRIESAGFDFYKKVRNGFLTIAAQEPDRIVVINSENAKSETHQMILNYLFMKFPNKFNLKK